VDPRDRGGAGSIAGLQKRIALTKQLAPLEYPGTTATAAAERAAMIAAAQHRAATFMPPRAAAGGGAPKGQADELETWRAELQARLEAEQSFFADSTGEELKFWQGKLALTASGSKEQAQVESVIYGLRKRMAQEGLREDEAAESRQESLDRTYLGAFQRNMQLMVAQKKISLQQALGFDIEYGERVEAQEKARLQAFLSDDRLSTAEKQQYYDRLLQLEANYDTRITGLAMQAAEATGKAWQKFSMQLSDSFASAAADVLDRTKSLMQAMDDMLRSLLKDTVESSFKSLFGSLLGAGSGGEGAGAGGGLNLTSLLFGSGGVGGMINKALGIGSGGLLGAAGNALGLGSLFGGTGSDQDFSGGTPGPGGVASGLTSAVSGGLLGGLFGKLFGGVGALFGFEHGGIVPSAAGGWAVPSLGPGGVLAQLHSQEMVLPANVSNAVLAGAQNGGGGPGIGAVNFSVSAMDSQSVASFFRQNGDVLAQALNRAWRNGSSFNPPGG